MTETSKLQERNARWKELGIAVNTGSSSQLLRGKTKIRWFNFAVLGGRAQALCWQDANFLAWKQWIRVVFQMGSLSVIDEKDKTDWRGLETIWENNCFSRRARITTYKTKQNK